MKPRIPLPLVLCLLSLSAGPARAGPGTTGANFLKIPVGPREVAMGEAGVASVQNAYGVWWNPAGLARLTAPETSFMYNRWFAGISEHFAAIGLPVGGRGALGGYFFKLGTEPFQGYDAQANPTGSVDAGDLSAGLSGTLLKRWTNASLGTGLTIKLIEEQLAGLRARTQAVDVGAQILAFGGLPDWGDHLAFGAAVQNLGLGPGLRFDRDAAPLPRTYRMGLSFSGEAVSDPFTLAADGVKTADAPAYPAIGFEYWVRRVLALRAGQRFGQDIGSGVRAGLGLRIHQIQFDYAWAGFGELGNTHRASVSIRFDRPADRPGGPSHLAEAHYQRGLEHYRAGRYGEAMIEFNKVLKRVPAHDEAKKMLRACFQKLHEKR